MSGREPHDFFWYATDVDTGSAKWTLLDEQATRTVVSGPVGGCDTAAAAANDDQIVFSGHAATLISLGVQPSPSRDGFEGKGQGVVEGSLRRRYFDWNTVMRHVFEHGSDPVLQGSWLGGFSDGCIVPEANGLCPEERRK
jgi:hypothetical protein